MPLQNRVLPDGKIVADPARGTLTGNRGCLHDGDRRIVRRWTTHAWIACRLEWKGVRRVPMTPGRWTELFFLDEAVALSAGHRPCACCRRADYNRFRAAWAAAFGAVVRAPEMDAVLHKARTGAPERLPVDDLPDGAFLRTDSGPALLWRGLAHPYRPDGYGEGTAVSGPVEVLTPAPMRAVLTAGYRLMPQPSLAG
ncbi:hypothetical protein [Frigidibacter sp. ROC022]|uniref:hypothetical protein n=1 Tax=Frigidibacter sp. ROC022 TaxID=2971796 RepID=UPI00215B3EDC|nr:hypothetical protein [Frigidibacter sp. ROC022]MCR8723251.1 hypothetical protein [Frigidibacter sp. ROC022]